MWADYPGLSRWTQNIIRVPYKKEVKKEKSEKEYGNVRRKGKVGGRWSISADRLQKQEEARNEFCPGTSGRNRPDQQLHFNPLRPLLDFLIPRTGRE